MKKGVTLGWVVNPTTGQRVCGSAAVERLAATGAQCARFAFDLGGHASWDSTIVSVYSGFLSDLAAVGITPLALVSNGAVPGPHNQQSDWNAGNKEVAGGSGNNAFQKVYAQSAGALVAAFGGQVTLWELWNEPNCWSSSSTTASGATAYSGSSFMYPSCYAALLTQACPLIPASATIITGGLLALGTDFSRSGGQYLYDLYNAGGWSSYNAPFGPPPRGSIGLHLYPAQGGALGQTDVGAIVAAIESALWWQENPSKRTPRPLYITEMGWQSSASTTGGLGQEAAALSVAVESLQHLPHIAAWSWFTLDDNPGAGQTYGLYDASGALKPVGQTYQALSAT